jgi:hypothetical protein
MATMQPAKKGPGDSVDYLYGPEPRQRIQHRAGAPEDAPQKSCEPSVSVEARVGRTAVLTSVGFERVVTYLFCRSCLNLMPENT